MLVGLVGILVPVLPGLVLVVAGIAVWAVPRNDAVGWTVLGVAVALVALGAVPSTCSRDAGCATPGCPAGRSLAGGVLGIVGFFVVPVVGLLLGFVLGVYLAELARVGRARGVAVARHALTAVGWSILIELRGGPAWRRSGVGRRRIAWRGVRGLGCARHVAVGETIRVGVLGARGRMGTEICRAVDGRAGPGAGGAGRPG